MPTNEELLDAMIGGILDWCIERAPGGLLPSIPDGVISQDRAAVLARMIPVEPSTIYDPKDGEWTVAWADRDDEDQVCIDAWDPPKRFRASVEVGEKWGVHILEDVDEDGDWNESHIEWFDTEADALAARTKSEQRPTLVSSDPAP